MSDLHPDLKLLTTEELIVQLRATRIEQASPYCEELILRFEPLLRRAWHEVGGEYEDFVQDVFLRLFAGLPQLRNPKAFPGYFRSVALSVASRWWRRERLAIKRSEEDIDRLLLHTDESLITGIFVRSYLEHLPIRERQIIELIFLEEWSMNDIAEFLDLEPGAVRATKSRALKKLRAFLLKDARALEESHKKR